MKQKNANKWLAALAALRMLLRTATRIVNLIRGKKTQKPAPEPETEPPAAG